MTKPRVIGWTREEMAQRLAQDIPNGSYVNLGIGIPELVAKFVPAGRTLIYHTENGMLGMGPAPSAGEGDPELINAGKQQVPGSAVTRCLPALSSSGSPSPGLGAGPMPSMPFSVW